MPKQCAGQREDDDGRGPRCRAVTTRAALLSVLLLGALRVPRAGAVAAAAATADTEGAELAVCRQCRRQD